MKATKESLFLKEKAKSFSNSKGFTVGFEPLLHYFYRRVEMVFEPRKARKNTKVIGVEFVLNVELGEHNLSCPS